MLGPSTVAFARRADPSTTTLPKLHLELVLSSNLTPGADSSEVSAIAQIWIGSIGIAQGLRVDTHTEVAATLEPIRAKVDANSVDLLTISALDYINLDRSKVMEPVVTMSASKDPKGKVKYLLLTNRDAGLTTVESLKDKSVLTYAHSEQELSRMWTEVLLIEHRLPPGETYFHSIASTLKPSTACLPVFFRKADACIIDETAWNTLKDLNPQVGAKLSPIAESPALLETVLSLHASRQQYRQEILNGVMELPLSPTGRQLLLFFKARQTYRISRADLAEVIELRRAYLKRFPNTDLKALVSRTAQTGTSPDVRKLQ